MEHLAASIAATAADYRKDELGPFTTAHVIHWAEQFAAADRLALLAELDHVLKKTYFSAAAVSDFLQSLIQAPNVVGPDPASFWRRAGLLDIQQSGHSQRDMLVRFEGILKHQFGVSLADCSGASGNFVYLDDAIFTGNRVRRDLEKWIRDTAPPKATVHIIVNALHLGGEHYAKEKLREAVRQAGKQVEIRWWRARSIENRKAYKYQSEVFWPSEFPEDEADPVVSYLSALRATGHPAEKRAQGGTPKDGVFSGEVGRASLERILLAAGVQIRSMCPYLPETARPLGYSKLVTPGFGATVVTYRNCPNNCPLALWAGDPWYPLFRRKTN